MHFVTNFLQFTGFRKSGGYGKILGAGQIGKEYPMNKAESSDGSATMAHTEPAENQIVVYQPNGVMKIDVRFDGETVWLLQAQIAELFSCSLENVRLHLKNIYACGELEKAATSKESLEVQKEGNRSVTRKFLYYNLDAIISIGYRVNSIVGVRFRVAERPRPQVLRLHEVGSRPPANSRPQPRRKMVYCAQSRKVPLNTESTDAAMAEQDSRFPAERDRTAGRAVIWCWTECVW